MTTAKRSTQTIINNMKTVEPVTIRFITILVMVGILVGSPVGVAYAQGGGAITTALSGVVLAIIEIIQGIAVVLGTAGLVLWGLAKVGRPVFPELMGMVSQYIPQLVIGFIVIFLADDIVQGLVAAVGG